jgi:hypothetical protein
LLANTISDYFKEKENLNENWIKKCVNLTFLNFVNTSHFQCDNVSLSIVELLLIVQSNNICTQNCSLSVNLPSCRMQILNESGDNEV